MVSVKIQSDKILQDIERNLYKAGLFLEGEVKKIVAIDTGALEESIKTFPVEHVGEHLKVSVGSDSIFYAGYVEFGVGKDYNYHRNGTVVHRGDGQHYLERSIDEHMNEIINIIKE